MSEFSEASSATAKPFDEFARSVTHQTGLRSAMTRAYRTPEPECVPPLLAEARLADTIATQQLAGKLAQALRNKQASIGVESLIHEFALSSQEGVALMCLAEALLRIPDTATRDALIRDKITQGNWQSHVGESRSLFVNAATWGLMLTGKLVSTSSERNLSSAVTRLIGKGGEPLIRRAVDLSMRLMGEHFVSGETISEALANSRKYEAKGFRYSYDMLGEAAINAADALRYFAAYEEAIHAIGKAAKGRGIYEGPGISIKLSALHPRYSRAQKERVMAELLPRVRDLAILGRQYDIGLNIDAEEADRLDLSLDILDALCHDPALAGWNGIGFVIQAYQKRAPYAVDYIIDLARRTQHRLMVRLVKGAYWDTEIKRAQMDGLPGYPVFTRKVYTDVCYLACAKRLLAAPDAVFPQFATHNAHTLAAVYYMAGQNFYPGQYEFQCLHGMGEPLYEEVVGKTSDGKLNRPCRIYAPVGTHDTLLAYLVRRLLENGANTSFVNRIADSDVSISDLTEDPIEVAERIQPLGSPHERIPLPRELYIAQGAGERLNSAGLDVSDEHRLVELADALVASAGDEWRASPTLADEQGFDQGRALPVHNPADYRDIVGYVVHASPHDVEHALQRADESAAAWAATPINTRAGCLLRAAQLLEDRLLPLVGLIVRESGKSFSNAISEVREAVDFLRYYALQIQRDFSNESHRAMGPVVCISPWNFPLAIFLGQVSAALAAGNSVLAKPAEQTSLIGAQGVQALHEAGVPEGVLQLVPGGGDDVGSLLTGDARVRAVMFTGSTEVARMIADSLAQRLNPDGGTVPLVAETGGQNAMVVDSSALPEQVIIDVIQSSFDSAGQRCSALRVLCLQEEIADRMLEMLKGAMRELTLGATDQLRVDIGPVIDADAQAGIVQHIEAMRARGFAITQLALPDNCEHGTFVPPTLIEIDSIRTLEREIFGPVLHVVRYRPSDVDRLIADINKTGYGLTFGVHSRIDERIAYLLDGVKVGNMYVNRNMIGAVVGVQPFGGERLSGTGPKAGGPLYVSRLLGTAPPNRPAGMAAAEQGLEPLRDYIEWLQNSGNSSAADLCLHMQARSLLNGSMVLPGPTGERNSYALGPRGPVLCVPATMLGAQVQFGAALATGNQAVFPVADRTAEIATRFATDLPAHLVQHVDLVNDDSIDSDEFIGAALFEGDKNGLIELNRRLARRAGPIVQAQGLGPQAIEQGQIYRLERLLAERSVSVNTAAAGGNASLMSIG